MWKGDLCKLDGVVGARLPAPLVQHLLHLHQIHVYGDAHVKAWRTHNGSRWSRDSEIPLSYLHASLPPSVGAECRYIATRGFIGIYIVFLCVCVCVCVCVCDAVGGGRGQGAWGGGGKIRGEGQDFAEMLPWLFVGTDEVCFVLSAGVWL